MRVILTMMAVGVLVVMVSSVPAAVSFTTEMYGPFNPSTTTDEIYYAGDVSSSDLLDGLAGTHTGWVDQNAGFDAHGAQAVSLNDGLAGGDYDAVGLPDALIGAAWAFNDNEHGTSVSEFVLGAGNGAGYDITEIRSIAAWVNAGLNNQHYTISVRYLGDTAYTVLTTVDYQPFGDSGDAGSSKVVVTDDSGVLASGVDAIRFEILATLGNDTYSTVFREIDVMGTPTEGSAVPLPVRIMPLGDSITVGYTDNPNWAVPFEFGYRSGLYTRLTNAGYYFQFVGESPEPWDGTSGLPTNTPPLDLQPLGQDKHRGYGGKSITWVNSNVAGYIATDQPDIILLLIGINGISTDSPAQLNTLVSTIFSADPDVHLVVAQITPYASYNQDLWDYNVYIRDTLVPAYAQQGYNITTVDLYSLFLTDPADPTSIASGVLANNINHPANALYDQMAQVWFEELVEILGPADPYGPSVDAGDDMITWSGQPVQLDPNVINNDPNDPQAALTYLWTSDPADGVVFSASDIEAPTVTIIKATDNPSIVTVSLAVSYVGSTYPDVTDTMEIEVYDTACDAAIIGKGLENDPTDITGDCVTDLEDLAELVSNWLLDTSLLDPVSK